MVFDSGITLQIALDCENEVQNQTWKQPSGLVQLNTERQPRSQQT